MRRAIKKLPYISALVIATLSLGAWTAAPAIQADGSGSYAANEVIGQTDANGNPSFTNANGNNDPLPKASGFSAPRDVAIDTVRHRLFVSDVGANRRVMVFMLDANNNPISQDATYVLGAPSLNESTDPEAPPSQSNFENRIVLEYDPVGDRLFTLEEERRRVMVFELAGGITNGMDASYVIGQPDFTSTGSELFYRPRDLVYDTADQRLFVTNGYYNVKVFDLSGGISNGMPASHQIGAPDPCTDPCDQSTKIYDPSGIDYDQANKRLFVSEMSTGRILVFDLTAGITPEMGASNVLGQPAMDPIDNVGYNPRPPDINSFCGMIGGLTYDPAEQRLAVDDDTCHRVMIFDLAGGVTNGMDASYVLNQPDFTSETEQQPSASAFRSAGMTFSGIGQLWLADEVNHRVLRFELQSGVTNGMAASLVLGQTKGGVPSFTQTFPNNAQIGPNGLGAPSDVIIDEVNHRLFVSDSSNYRILVYLLNADNTLTDHTADYALGAPDLTTHNQPQPSASTFAAYGMTYDPVQNRLFVNDLGVGRVLVFELSGGITNGMDASYVLGKPDFTSQSQAFDAATVSGPFGSTYDAEEQRLFVGDMYSNRILVFELGGGITNGMDASYVLGQADFTTANPPPEASYAAVLSPAGMDYDPDGKRLFVADMGKCRVMVFDLSTGIANNMEASEVIGQPDQYSNVECARAQNQFVVPYDVTYDNQHEMLYVLDGEGSRAMGFDLADGIKPFMDASNIIGSDSFDAPTSQPSVNEYTLTNPMGISLAAETRQLYVADSYNHRILTYDLVRLLGLPQTDLTLGEQFSAQVAEGYQGTLSYELVSGELPPGITFSVETGKLIGIPTAAGNYVFTIKVTDDNTTAGKHYDTRTYSLNVPAPYVPPSPTDPGTPPSPVPPQPNVTTGASAKPTPSTAQQAAGTGGNPVYTLSATNTPVNPPAPPPEHGCLQAIDLDAHPEYTDGPGYEVEVDNCYAFYFATYDESGNAEPFALAVDAVQPNAVEVSLAPKDHFDTLISHATVAPNEPTTVLAAKPDTTYNLGVRTTAITYPKARILLAKAYPPAPQPEPAKTSYTWLWKPLLAIMLGGAVIFFTIRHFRNKRPGAGGGPPTTFYNSEHTQ